MREYIAAKHQRRNGPRNHRHLSFARLSRPKGSRNKLGEKFIEDAYAEWRRSGPRALKTMAETDPGGFVRMIAGILPAKLDVTIEHELFAAASTFAEAFRIARQHVSDEETLELKAIEHETNRD